MEDRGTKIMIVGTRNTGKSVVAEVLRGRGFKGEVEIVEFEGSIKEEVFKAPAELPILQVESLSDSIDRYPKMPKFQYEDKVHKARMKYGKRRGR